MMRNVKLLLVMTLSVLAFASHADQKTLDAIQATEVELTTEQVNGFPKGTCEPTEDQIKSNELPDECITLVDAITGLIIANSTDDPAVEAILRAASEAHPELAQAFGDAAMEAVPEQIALIADLMTELAPTAAGATGPTLANITNNTPVSIGGGGSASPN